MEKINKKYRMVKTKTSGITGSYDITRPFAHFGKTAMGKGLGERAFMPTMLK